MKVWGLLLIAILQTVLSTPGDIKNSHVDRTERQGEGEGEGEGEREKEHEHGHGHGQDETEEFEPGEGPEGTRTQEHEHKHKQKQNNKRDPRQEGQRNGGRDRADEGKKTEREDEGEVIDFEPRGVESKGREMGDQRFPGLLQEVKNAIAREVWRRNNSIRLIDATRDG